MKGFSKIGFLLLLFLVACQEAILLQDLDQKNANDVLVVLSKNGIQAQKEAVLKQQATSWTIKVSAEDEQKAREILVASNLPRQKELGLSGICKEAGLIPTPKTEKCREMLALKGEIINSLQSVPGVISADIVINMPDKQDFPDENTPQQRPTASVVLQVGDMPDPESFPESKIQQFVANAVTGMDMRDVVVMVSRLAPIVPLEKKALGIEDEASEPALGEEDNDEAVDANLVSVGGIEMNEESAGKFKLFAGVILFLFVLLSGGLITLLLKMARSRQKTGGAESHALQAVLSDKSDKPFQSSVEDVGEKMESF